MKHKQICRLLIFWLAPAVVVSAQDIIAIDSVEDESGVQITATNTSPIAAVINFTVSGRNIESNCLNSCVRDIPAHKQIIIDIISPVNKHKNWQYSTQYGSHLGSIVTHYNSEYTYWPAFAHGEKFHLSQGFNGNFSHQGINAIDFSLPHGTPVHAARSGKVIWIEEAYKKGGLSADFKNKANYIAIEHDDGTQATYAHLKYNGAFVNVGEHVVKGQAIGLSGDTGYGKGPHLHFEVSRITSQGELESLPFKIRSRYGLSDYPRVGYYYAVDDRKPAVKEIYADEIDFSHYFERDHPVSIKTVKDRQVKLDDYVLIYIQNGKSRSIEVGIDVNLQGYQSLRTIPAKIIIKPRTEKLVAVVHRTLGAQTSRFKYTYSYREVQ